MRRRPATRAAWYVDFLFSPRPPLARRHDASGPTALPRECHICQSRLHPAIFRPRTATAAETGSPVPLVSGIGEEAATPWATRHAFARVFRTVLRRFTLENHRLLQALPQSSGKFRKLSRFRCSHSPSRPRSSQQKTSPPLCRNCGR